MNSIWKRPKENIVENKCWLSHSIWICLTMFWPNLRMTIIRHVKKGKIRICWWRTSRPKTETTAQLSLKSTKTTIFSTKSSRNKTETSIRPWTANSSILKNNLDASKINQLQALNQLFLTSHQAIDLTLNTKHLEEAYAVIGKASPNRHLWFLSLMVYHRPEIACLKMVLRLKTTRRILIIDLPSQRGKPHHL